MGVKSVEWDSEIMKIEVVLPAVTKLMFRLGEAQRKRREKKQLVFQTDKQISNS